MVIPVPWDVTVSSKAGTSRAAENIMKASLQLDLFDPEIKEAWKLGIYVRDIDGKWLETNDRMRIKAKDLIKRIENGLILKENFAAQKLLESINISCSEMHANVYKETKKLLQNGKLPGILGGEHSVALGLLKALHEKYGKFGVLQIDAHQDLRQAYEGFTYSHASVFYNALQQEFISALVQVGIRDNCQEEANFAAKHNIETYYDAILQKKAYRGYSWHDQCEYIIANLPAKVYISFDIDGLKPDLCPNTGTPVPGGLEYNEAIYLIKEIAKSGRKIIGFDLSEVAGEGEWDGNVGARVLYNLCNWAGRSQGWI